MVYETEQAPLVFIVLYYCIVLACLRGVGLVAGYIAAAVLHGPRQGGRVLGKVVWELAVDWLQTSPRRVLALSMLAFRESIRRKVLYAFGVLLVFFLLAGWFLDDRGDRAAAMYLNLAMFSTTMLIVIMAVVLSCFSLPADFQDRTIFTIVSKPVRRHEIVLGRVIGFTFTGTILLTCMGVVSYLFVINGLSHEHVLRDYEIKTVDLDETEENPLVHRGKTIQEHGHRHEVYFHQDGTAEADDLAGHTHDVRQNKENGKLTASLGATRRMLRARIPLYGTLQFFDREGKAKNKGINVGKEWGYRGCVEGGNESRAVWTFHGVTKDHFSQGFLPLELTLGVFRTYKGQVDAGIAGSIQLENPTTGRTTNPRTFVAREYYTDRINIPEQLESADGPVSLFDEDPSKALVDPKGNLIITVRCEDRAQFYCMAQHDLSLRAGDTFFEWNFFKGHIGVWLQLVLAIVIGVTCSTFLRGPVAMCLTFGVIGGGHFTKFMHSVSTGQLEGGGPLESVIRIYINLAPVIALPDSEWVNWVQMFDQLMKQGVYVAGHLVPDFVAYNQSDFVARGYNIDPGVLTMNVLGAAAYVIPAIIIGHLCLKLRQVG
ncbi:MAG: ABC transporter permease [Planctomycetales bacterium]